LAFALQKLLSLEVIILHSASRAWTIRSRVNHREQQKMIATAL